MYFKGRTVVVLLLMTMVASVLVTLSIGDQIPTSGKRASVSAAAASDRNGLSAKEESKINAVLGLIETKYFKDIDRDELVDGAVRGMMESLDDPYSVYMEKDVAKQFSESIEGSFSGIGAEVTLEKGKVVVVAPIKGSPAEKAGLLAKDIVLSVNGDKLDGLTLNDAVGKIRGPKGTKAKLRIERSGNTQPIDLILVRDDIDVETVYANLRDDGVGVIEIRQFSLNTADRFKEELAKLEKQGMKGLVIDVRNDPGGVLPVVVEIAQQFIPKGETIVQVEDRDGHRDKTTSQGGGKDYPIAVLMNKGSASASEILAGALQERAGATLVGETSYGKGTVQVSYNKTLGDGSLVKMTIAKWLTPDGNWIHQKGIKPNVEVQPPKLYTVARFSLTDTLRKDMIGEQIRNAQVMLSGLGYTTQREDGYYNAETEQAVRTFQTDAGLPVTGELDAKTAGALEQAVVKWIKDNKNDKQLLEAIKTVSRK
ncbi:S41 family peptidase [Paenibacillus glycanilyticus]|uniref:Carboxy-terminal processing protease CtpB n=1 Tax=Paenibacillus glycanilyticus TaxID=126569 RepID=A0ABQ6GMP6_9BACL|nr:S41 family peptidase [Paenibacillus glycanilyticus]GLX70911.1 carboxy-terminal processing protease CtpB [Paenibacillus glycanilyticus]